MDPSIHTADGQLLAIIRQELRHSVSNPRRPSFYRKTVEHTLIPALDRAIQLTEMEKIVTLTEEDADMLTAKLAKHNILRAVDHLTYMSSEGGYQFHAGPEVEDDDILDEFHFVNDQGVSWPEGAILGLLAENGPWFRETLNAGYDGPTDGYDGPTDAEIEDQEIERQIEYSEEALRGEHGEEEQRKEEARQHANQDSEREEMRLETERKRLIRALGSPALVKACMDDFDYALKLKSGEVIRFHYADWHGNGWLTLSGIDREDVMAAERRLPFPADRGVDVRLEEILWVMDAPRGS